MNDVPCHIREVRDSSGDCVKDCGPDKELVNDICMTLVEAWEEQIDDSKLEPCLSDKLNSLKSINSGIGSFIQEINNSESFNWKLESKTISNDGSGQITYGYTEINLYEDGAITYLDGNKLSEASDIGIVSLILHESMHAYLHYRYRNQNISKNYIDLFERYYSEKSENEQWVNDDFISNMASTLESYGNSKGYNYSLDYYRKIAWGD